MPSVRPVELADYAAIAALFHSAVHELASRDYRSDQCRAWSDQVLPPEHWQRRTAQLEILVAEIKGQIAGFIGFRRDGYIDLLYTHPHFARRGVARALTEAAESNQRQAGATRAWTEASLTAQPFFTSLGYQILARQTVSCRGVDLTNFRMEKHFGPPQP